MRSAFIFALATALSQTVSATYADTLDKNINEITIRAYTAVAVISSPSLNQPLPIADSSEFLSKIPGANVNSNGALTGIAQYRGLFGDRVSVALDGAPLLTGGPNAMDTPLSYAPAALLAELSLHRGIAPVSVAQESLGGHIQVQLDRGQFNQLGKFKFSGLANSQFADNGQQASSNLRMVAANNQHRLALLLSHSKGANSKAGDGSVRQGTQHQRSRSDLSYAWQDQTRSAEIFMGQHYVKNTGTAALAMDIASIDTDLLGINLSADINGLNLTGHLAWSDVVHFMDNHSLRQSPLMAMNYRTNLATADNLSWTLKAQIPVAFSQLTLGTDGNLSNHQAIISNPQNSLFELINFNAVERDIIGLFAELDGLVGRNWQYQLGVRFNQISLDAGQVAATGMLGMMANNANALAMQFNAAQRDIQQHNTDLLVKLSRDISSTTHLNIDLGIKQRAPAYQELYLWLPLPVTAGLADGRSYIGNLQLNAESANEINLGIEHSRDKFYFAPQIFYRRINDYIQGMPTSDMTANRISHMMSGAPALMHSNLEAEIYGLDADWRYRLSPNWSIDGLVSYVRGKQTQTGDNLYRIAPPNSRISLHFHPQSHESRLRLTLESHLYAKQTKTASFNQEQSSAGYAIVNISGRWSISQSLQLWAGIGNLLDRAASHHLSGRNRLTGSDIAVGQAMPELGRNLSLGLQISW